MRERDRPQSRPPALRGTTLTFRVTLNAVLPDATTTLDNVVICPLVEGQPNPLCHTTTTVEAAPNVQLAKQVKSPADSDWTQSDTAAPGDTLYFRIVVTNSGDANATGLTVTDVLSAALVANSDAFDSTTCSPAYSYNGGTRTITWSGLGVTAGGSTTLTFSVHLATGSWVAGSTDLGNSVVPGEGQSCLEEGLCETITTVTTGTDLSIVKSADPTENFGGVDTPVTYTLVVHNAGSGATPTAILVKDDDLPAFFSITTVTCAPTVSGCDAAHLTGAGIDLGPIAGGGTVTITVEGTASPNTTADLGDHPNTASACTSETEPVCVHDSAAVAVSHPAIAVVKSASTHSLPVGGGSVTYTYTVTNPGNEPLSSVTLSDDTCSPVTFVSGATNSNALLDLTETWTFTCTRNITASTTNVATATGHYEEQTVQATDRQTVTVATNMGGGGSTPTPTPAITPPATDITTGGSSSNGGSLALVLMLLGRGTAGLLAFAPRPKRRAERGTGTADGPDPRA